MKARYLNSGYNRFISQDGIFQAIGDEDKIMELGGKDLNVFLRDPQSLNSYSYARNNPYVFIDPTGYSIQSFFTNAYHNSFSSFANSRPEYSAQQVQSTSYQNLPTYYRQIGDPDGSARLNVQKQRDNIATQFGVSLLAEGLRVPARSGFSTAGLSADATSFLNKGEPVSVYIGYKNGIDSYIGITNDLTKRTYQHGNRFDKIDALISGPTRNQGRAIEQAGINFNPQYQNIINSISSNNAVYNEVVTWGSKILKEIKSKK